MYLPPRHSGAPLEDRARESCSESRDVDSAVRAISQERGLDIAGRRALAGFAGSPPVTNRTKGSNGWPSTEKQSLAWY